jgi:hypothetical protein
MSEEIKLDYIDEYRRVLKGKSVEGKTKKEVIDNFYSQARKDVYWGMRKRYIDDYFLVD